MADFRTAYKNHIEPNEGGYANIAQDKGGETYAGIARNFNPTWAGWAYIDAEKKRVGTIKNNAKFPAIQHLVEDFYKKRWDSIKLSQVNSQEVASLVFDYHVHSGSHAIKALQLAVNRTANGVMSVDTVAAVNRADARQVYASVLAHRRSLINGLLAKNPSQEVFRKGWEIRLASFERILSVFKQPETGLPILGIAALVVGGVVLYNVRKKKQPEELETNYRIAA